MSSYQDRLHSVRNQGQEMLAGVDVSKVLTFAGGGVVGACILFGAKRLYQYMATPSSIDRPTSLYICSPSHTSLSTTCTPLPTPCTTPHHTPLIRRRSLNLNMSIPDVVPATDSPVTPTTTPTLTLTPTTPTLPQGSVDVDSRRGSTAGSTAGSTVDNAESCTESGAATPVKEGSVSPAEISYLQSLNSQLLDFNEQYCLINHEILASIQAVRDELAMLFEQYCAELLPKIPIRALHPAPFNPQVCSVQRVEIRIPLELDPQVWKILDAGDSVLSAHGYCFIRRQQLEFFSPGTSQYDRFLLAGYLPPRKVKEVFHDMTHRIGKWGDMTVKSSVVGTDILLTVYGQNDSMLEVSFIPEVTLNGLTVVGVPHPRSHTDSSYDNLWQCCYSKQTLTSLRTPDQAGCQMLLLQILLALRRLHPLLAELSVDVMTAALLHILSTETDWQDDKLAERFIQCLHYMEVSCGKHVLTRPGHSQYNLLMYAHRETSQEIAQQLAEVRTQNAYKWLIYTEHL